MYYTGSASAHYQLLNKESRNYFKRIILLSSVATNYYARSTVADHKNIMYEFAENQSGRLIGSDDELVSTLQTVDARNVTLFKRLDEILSVLETIWSPVYDGLYDISGAANQKVLNYLHFIIFYAFYVGNGNDSFMKNSPEKLYEEYKAEGVEKTALFSFTSMVRMNF